MNRSVNAPKHYPQPPHADSGTSTTNTAPAQQPDSPQPAGVPKPKKPLIGRLRARRAGRAVVANVAFEHDADLKWAVAWLSRNGTVVGSATVRHVHGKHASLRIPFRNRLRGGHYKLTVGTMDHHGHDEYKAIRIVLQ